MRDADGDVACLLCGRVVETAPDAKGRVRATVRAPRRLVTWTQTPEARRRISEAACKRWQARARPSLEAALAVVSACPSGAMTGTVALRVGVSGTHAYRLLRRLEDAGLVERTARGRYTRRQTLGEVPIITTPQVPPLFPGGPGRTRSNADLQTEIESITSRLYVLPDEVAVYPGHGANTTIGASKAEYAVFASKPHDPGLCGDVLWLES